MAATRAKEAEQHTPFCERDCNISHHELIKALFSFNNFSDGYSNPGNLHSFYENVQSFISRGWNKDSIVPDPSRDLQCPLVYLACAFGKHKALSLLLKMDFEPSGCIRQTGETALHAAVRYVYQSGAWSVNNSKKGVTKVRPKTRTSSFEKILESLCEKSPEIIGQKDINWDTPLHVGANELADIQTNELECSGTKLLMALNNRKLHFEQCFRSMLLKVGQLEEQGIISAERALQIICCKNRERKSILNIISERSSEKDNLLECLKGLLSKLDKKLSSGTFSEKGSLLGTQISLSQETVPTNSMVSPSSNTPTLDIQGKWSRRKKRNQIDGKQLPEQTNNQFCNPEDRMEESSTVLHVVFGHRDQNMPQATVCSLRSLPEFASPIANAIMISEPVSNKQSQRKTNNLRRKSSDFSPQMNKIPSSLMQIQSIPQTSNNSLTCTEKPMLPGDVHSDNVQDRQPMCTNVCVVPNENQTTNPSKVDLRKEVREAHQATTLLEKECFRLESERLECLHAIKERKEFVENIHKEIFQLEQRANFLANSKSVIETDWKLCQQKEKDLKILLHSSNLKAKHNELSSKILKLE